MLKHLRLVCLLLCLTTFLQLHVLNVTARVLIEVVCFLSSSRQRWVSAECVVKQNRSVRCLGEGKAAVEG